MADRISDDDQDLTLGSIPVLVRRLAIPASIGFFLTPCTMCWILFMRVSFPPRHWRPSHCPFRFFFLIIAFGYGLSTGATVLISNYLGAGNREKAIRYTAQSISYAVLLSIGLTIFGYFSAPFLFQNFRYYGPVRIILQ